MYPIHDLDDYLRRRAEIGRLFDFYRLVDPETHLIYDFKHGELIQADDPSCHAIWQRDEPCKNCTSLRAKIENRTIVKLECNAYHFFLIYSLPIDIFDKSFVMELIKDVDDSLMVNAGCAPDNTNIMNLVSEMNIAILTDPFTGLFNKKFFLTDVPATIGQSRKNGSPYCGAVFDIDRFKHVNDSFGHLIGDTVIMFIAELFKETEKTAPIKAFRIGGDEFYIGFSGLHFLEAERICNSIRERVANHRFVSGGDQSFSVTISYGLEEYDFASAPSIRSYLDEIDKKMYEAKNQFWKHHGIGPTSDF